MQIAQALSWASSELAEHEGKADASALLLHVLQKPRSYLFGWPEVELTPVQEQSFRALVAKRTTGVPVAHLTGVREFWSLPVKVNASTLIPRPDTESLVEWALELLPQGPAQIMDLGTGTGAIALALASECSAWQITALDLMSGAVALAQQNAQMLGLETQLQIKQSDWFSALTAEPKWQLIVSNPPYIEESDPHLSEGDVRFEPKSALTSGRDGLDDIRKLVNQAPKYLAATGWLLLEHGYDQAQAVADLFRAAGFSQVSTRQDLAGNPRITGGCWLGE